MEQFQESTDHLVNLQKVEDVSTKDNHQNAEKVFSQGFPQSENVNKGENNSYKPLFISF